MVNYSVLTVPTENWHLIKLDKQLKSAYSSFLHSIVLKITNEEIQLASFYNQLFSLEIEKEQMNDSEAFEILKRRRFRWNGLDSYFYCLVDELFLQILLMFPQHRQRILEMMIAHDLKPEKIEYVTSFAEVLRNKKTVNVNHYIAENKVKKTLAFWSQIDNPVEDLGTFMIVGTMSSGKSTLLNNLLDADWAKTQNMVATNFSLSYRHHPNLTYPFLSNSKYKVESSSRRISTWLDQMNESNDANVNNMMLWSGQSHPLLSDYSYTLIDTPGTNSSWKAHHHQVTKSTLLNYKYDKVIVVLNATQFGTDDEKELLVLIKDCANTSSILFVLNKIDELDTDLGESVDQYIVSAKKFLEENHFENPQVIATSALAVSVIKKDEEQLTRRENRLKKYFHEYFDLKGDVEKDDLYEKTGFSHILNYLKN